MDKLNIFFQIMAGLLTLLSSAYIVVVTFFIIHRMNKRTPWKLASLIISVAAIGIYGLIQTLAFMFELSERIPFLMMIITDICTVILLMNPKINVNPPNDVLREEKGV